VRKRRKDLWKPFRHKDGAGRTAGARI
jgi:hypothetical protein